MHVVGLDIGGAHVKAADGDGRACSVPYAIWKAPQRLSEVLEQTLEGFSPPDLLAVTMTAELADCFTTKAEGVNAILTSVEEVAGGTPIAVWQTGAEFVAPEVAREIPLMVAAANWHALATFVGRMHPRGGALLIDVGSTTTDMIPLHDGVPIPVGFTDCERLQSGELVYTGVRRTPLCALAHSVPLRGQTCRVAAELFATTLDVYLLLEKLPEDANDRETANGRPATREAAHDRVARMLCCDHTELERHDARELAAHFAGVQRQYLTQAITDVLQRMPAPCDQVLVSGSGAFLAMESVSESPLAEIAVVDLRETFTREIAESACAYALARLALERAAGGV